MNNQEKGAKGELIAQEFLLKNGFDILANNWRFKKGEIDIIAQKGNTIHFVEVKARKNNNFGNPEDSVSLSKQRKLAQTASAFLFAISGAPECQFDIIAITGNLHEKYQLEYFPDAFFPFE